MNFSENVRAAFRRGDSDAVVQVSQAEIIRARAVGDAAGAVEALYALARVALRADDLSEARRLANDALEIATRAGVRVLEERPRHVLAAVARMSGDFVLARELYEANIALNTDLGQLEIANSELHNLAFTELHLGNADRARVLFDSVREQVFRGGYPDFVPYVCLAAARMASLDENHERTALLLGLTNSAFRKIGQVPDPDDAKELEVVRDIAVEALGEERFQIAHARGITLDPRETLTSTTF